MDNIRGRREHYVIRRV
ncbi:hypothetical protein CP8484711_0588A, partial [Chlamydia psittaci 84-8471/1]